MNRFRLLLAIGAVLLPGAAMACDIPGYREDPATVALRAREIVQRSTAIIDAEVVTPSGGSGTAQLRPLRVLKGPPLPLFLVGSPSNCHILFPRAGVRMRIVLSGGPERFSASITDNGANFPTRTGLRRFDAALDALLGVPRPRGFVSPLQ